jgi:hypothetical protein
MPLSSRSLSKPILFAGLVAGTLDISDALIFYYIRSNVAPMRLLQGIASGVLGKQAFSGGWGTAALGLALHFLIATIWAALFILAARSLPVLRRYAIPCGIAYGCVVYVVMNYVVVPLSRSHGTPPHATVPLINAIAALVFCIGIPIALINKRFS